jgi:hypothetical protein
MKTTVGLKRGVLFLLAGLCMVVAAESHADSTANGPLPEIVSFNAHIRPIFNKKCVACHGGVKQASGLSFIYRESALAEAESGERPIVPGKPNESELLARVSSWDSDYRMPPAEHGPPLSGQEVALLRKWIEQGAKWEEHWAFVRPVAQSPPSVQRPDWCRQDFDRFVLASLEAKGLSRSKDAPRSEWLRRVSLDLVGLPPTGAEVSAFQADDSADAYERVVDRLLKSKKFGERWASMWLDLARYSDTVGFERDPTRTVWPYRDWLIRALNADMSFDEFTIKQLAGDLLPDRSLDDRIATAFQRNTQTNTECGSDDEEFRISAVIDRTNTTWQVWGALTFGCAQCHSHPYDPIRNEEFYKFTAFYNTSQDTDLGEELPTLSVPVKPAQFEEAHRLDKRISELRSALRDAALPIAQHSSNWKNVEFDDVASTGQTRLKTRTDANEHVSEVVTVGTITAYSQYTLVGEVPRGVEIIRAIKLDVLPKDVAAAIKIPESGFTLSQLSAEVIVPGRKQPIPLTFETVICDDANPAIDPEESLRAGWPGFASHSKIDRPHWAVFIVREPVETPRGSRLRLVLKHGTVDSGQGALVIERARYWLSADPAWSDHVESPTFKRDRALLAELRHKRDKLTSVSMPVMEEQSPNERRMTYVFERGNWMAKGDIVSPGVAAIFPPLDSSAPPDRLAMARWLVSGKHPLTSRVLVNRVWEQLFGTGIVRTAGDFGSSGEAPSHPQLLDFLALRFQNEHAWHVKPLLRELVLSATYRQSSRRSPELAASDPANRLLARGPRQRLTAEMIRDEALAVSGLLSDRMYGPPVMPPQPEGVWRTVYNGSTWKTSTGGDRYRRAVYTFWKRTSGYPSMLTFDAPARDVCSVQRIVTNTPLQALVTLNDPALLECADGLATRMANEGGATPKDQIAWAFQQATTAEISSSTLRELLSLYNDSLSGQQSNQGGSSSPSADTQHFALKIVAHTILNLDDALTR